MAWLQDVGLGFRGHCEIRQCARVDEPDRVVEHLAIDEGSIENRCGVGSSRSKGTIERATQSVQAGPGRSAARSKKGGVKIGIVHPWIAEHAGF